MDCTVHGVAELDMTGRLSLHSHPFTLGHYRVSTVMALHLEIVFAVSHNDKSILFPNVILNQCGEPGSEGKERQ